MASVTTNYGFDVPTSSDLVKNGATQIALLGQDLDTFLFRPFSKNAVINGAMDIWARGTSFTISASSATYTADRWQVLRGATGLTVSRQVTNDTTNLPFIQYCARVQRANGNSATDIIYIDQSFESVNSIPFAGKTVTISFYARAGANYSPTSNALSASLISGTGTDQNGFSGFTGAATTASTTATLTTTWQRFTFTGTIATNATQLLVRFNNTPTGTAGANDYFEVTGIQLEAGSQATPFSRMAGTIQGELAACQRYYYRQTAGEAYSVFGNGIAASTTNARVLVTLPVTMRVKAASLEFSNIALYDGVTTTAITSAVVSEANFQTFNVNSTVASGLTQYRPYQIIANNSTSAHIGVTAEL